jgi:hypothetical protein|tara:strand:- start:1937 stop:2179 length:243 start_codon:yes stop_codon:yes gene_type:complete
MFPFEMQDSLDELATSVEKFYPMEPKKAFEEFLGWGKGDIIASIAFNLAWDYLAFLYVQKNPIASTRLTRPTDLVKPSMN